MRFKATVAIVVPGEQVLREPTFWDRMKRRLGGEPDLRTERMRAAIEATALVDGTQHALRRLGVDDAVSLIVDDQVLFHDRDGRAGDLGDLFVAFHDAAPVFGKEFSMLRLSAEHAEAGLHAVFELIATSVHAVDEPAARVVVSGRLQAFEPRAGEDAEAYRQRVEPLTRDAGLIEAHRHGFDSLAARLADALRASLPEARVELERAEAVVQRPSSGAARRRRAAAPPPTSRQYDPHDAWYPNPMDSVLSFMLWSSVLSMAMPPSVVVVDDQGRELGSAEEVGHDPQAAEAGDDGDGGDGGDVDVGGDVGDFGGDFGGFD